MAELVVIGLIVGSIIALGAIGLTLVYGILKFANFAHGDLMTAGAYLAFFAYYGGGHIGPLFRLRDDPGDPGGDGCRRSHVSGD